MLTFAQFDQVWECPPQWVNKGDKSTTFQECGGFHSSFTAHINLSIHPIKITFRQ